MLPRDHTPAGAPPPLPGDGEHRVAQPGTAQLPAGARGWPSGGGGVCEVYIVGPRRVEQSRAERAVSAVCSETRRRRCCSRSAAARPREGELGPRNSPWIPTKPRNRNTLPDVVTWFWSGILENCYLAATAWARENGLPANGRGAVARDWRPG